MTPDPVGAYLDRLLGHLRGSAADVRRILAETEEHLRDAVSEGMAAGLGQDEAQRQAIARFGDPHVLARQFSGQLSPVPQSVVLAELARTVVLLGAVALVAIGVSGALAEVFGRVFGPGFVAGDLPGTTYTPQRCAYFLEYFPQARTCGQAAALHHWGEVVEYRVAAGVLGLLVLVATIPWRRRRDSGYLGVLPDGVPATVAASLYAVAAAILLLQSLDADLVAGGAGNGQWLSGGLVALVMAVGYGSVLYRTVVLRAGPSPVQR